MLFETQWGINSRLHTFAQPLGVYSAKAKGKEKAEGKSLKREGKAKGTWINYLFRQR